MMKALVKIERSHDRNVMNTSAVRDSRVTWHQVELYDGTVMRITVCDLTWFTNDPQPGLIRTFQVVE